MMVVDVSTAPTLTVGVPRMLFQGDFLSGSSPRANYDVTRDGQRFVMVAPILPDSTPPRPRIEVVLNWFEELRNRVP